MGVTGLWTVLQPAARPIKIETLNKKRLAVDASIWIYQFLKAVRDKEGNALRNSHIVGFFRRICKLLFIGIKPVFVFDGGAPALKRQTISGRKARREGRREDAVRTAGKLLAMQMQRRAEEEDEERKRKKQRENAEVVTRALQEEEEVPDDAVYVDELQMTQQERQQSRKFKKKDQYHLPNLDTPLAEMGQPNDPRVMSLEELQTYADQFNTGEDINVYDFSKIDFESQFFTSLPASDRYNILNAARLRSRLRMGLSKEQLDTMFPNRMDFSRFQVDRVRERNELTQRLMSINNNDEPWSIDGGGRIAGEKGREYVLVKNDGVEGGWALGVISDNTEGQRSKPIDVDEITRKAKKQEADEEEDSDDDAFEDVPVEGLNRLPKLPQRAKPSMTEQAVRNTFKKRAAQYQSRRPQGLATKGPPPRLATEESDSLFIDQDTVNEENTAADTDDEELQRAIAMSLETNDESTSAPTLTRASSPDDDDFEEVFGAEKTVAAQKPATTPAARRAIPFMDDDSDDEQYTMDMDKALNESRGSMYKSRTSPKSPPPAQALSPKPKAVGKPAFSGPLPFEKLDLGSSLLGKKKMAQREEEAAGGFERDVKKDTSKKQTGEPIPPWFNADVKDGLDEQNVMEGMDRLKEREEVEHANFEFVSKPARLRQHDTNEVIDLDALADNRTDVINVDDSDDDMEDVFSSTSTRPKKTIVIDDEIRMGDMADKVRAEPPVPGNTMPAQQREPETEPRTEAALEKAVEKIESAVPKHVQPVALTEPAKDDSSDEESIEWEESDHEEAIVQAAKVTRPAGGPMKAQKSPSPDFEFEDVDIPAPPIATKPMSKSPSPLFVDSDDDNIIHPAAGTADDLLPAEDDDPAEDADRDYYSDLSDVELLEQLATETEEHARFASQIRHQKSTTHHQQSTEEFDRELKALRSQQRADRRDADEVTQTMILECQQLLTHFGLPYITAPMEAEAQCAELVKLHLVDGIVTDDSDIFLFGGTRVYKNMFNAAKYVECYLASDLEREFDLSRNKMIAIAHLLGSDYTEGLPGVGPVTALEILSEFPNGKSGGLVEFKEWWTRVQMGAPPSDLDKSSDFRRKFRKKSAKLFLPPVFPDLRVDVAYLEPEVDSDPSAFVWGVPDLDSLRSFLTATIGWTQERTDEVLVPVIRDMNRREKEGTQSNITQFLGGSVGVGARTAIGSGSTGMAGGGDHEGFAPRRKDVGKSRRMEVALERLADKARERRRTGTAEKTAGDLITAHGEDDIPVSTTAIASMAAVDSNKPKKTRQKKDTATKAKAKPRTTGRKRKAAADLADEGDEDEALDVEDAAEGDDVPTPKPKKKKRAARKGKKQIADDEEDD